MRLHHTAKNLEKEKRRVAYTIKRVFQIGLFN